MVSRRVQFPPTLQMALDTRKQAKQRRRVSATGIALLYKITDSNSLTRESAYKKGPPSEPSRERDLILLNRNKYYASRGSVAKFIPAFTNSNFKNLQQEQSHKAIEVLIQSCAIMGEMNKAFFYYICIQGR